ncbi:UNVERIFIED_CONTAM: hypothetical protein Sindi_1511100 [Sesamum indicum]
MRVSSEGDRTSRRRKTWPDRDSTTSRIALLLCLAFLLILSEAPSGGARRFQARSKPPSLGRQHARSASSPQEFVERSHTHYSSSEDKLYEEEKRLVHTGPNPLHN